MTLKARLRRCTFIFSRKNLEKANVLDAEFESRDKQVQPRATAAPAA